MSGYSREDELYRYWLQREFQNGNGKKVCWIMLNPSTADAIRDDPTIRRISRFTMEWGYSALTVVNLYPFRSSDPKECRRRANWEQNGPDWYDRDALCHNLESVVPRTAKQADLVIAAWGSAPWQDLSDRVVEEIQSGFAPYPDIYTLLPGKPIHPLARGKHRVPDGAKPVLWLNGA